ncbi:MAG: hypothetical protein AAB407_03810 [Patescibacteria group bacterium]
MKRTRSFVVILPLLIFFFLLTAAGMFFKAPRSNSVSHSAAPSNKPVEEGVKSQVSTAEESQIKKTALAKITNQQIPIQQVPVAKQPEAASTVSVVPILRANVIEETEIEEKSVNSMWWLNSGALFEIDGDIVRTNTGTLPEASPWRRAYSSTNPIDTDQGYRPQNLFRLLTRDTWKNVEEKMYVRILSYNETPSPNRNDSNGIFLLGRYQSEATLYLAGIRVDGAAVIKKKLNGKYYTLAYKPEWSGTGENLLPQNSWIGIMSRVEDTDNGTVRITLSLDKENKGEWVQVLTIEDSEKSDTGSPILESGHAGIRSDFMDLEFRQMVFSDPGG